MKKWISGLLIVLVFGMISIYVFIPSLIIVSGARKIAASGNGSARFLLDQKKWPAWWNLKDSSSSASFSQHGTDFICNEDTFRLAELFHMSADIDIHHEGKSVASKLLLISLSIDTTGLQWSCVLHAGNNPLKRLSQYQQARSLKKNIDLVLGRMQSFLEKPENVYGISLLRTSIKDTLLISNKAVFKSVPNTASIYQQVKQLQEYAAKNGAVQNGNPIFHVTLLDSNHYELMTALPVNKILAGDRSFSFKRMVPGSFIITDVRGGEYSVAHAQQNMKQFFTDYNKTSMAIDFQMLVTDRIKNPDTTQWITRLYEPVY